MRSRRKAKGNALRRQVERAYRREHRFCPEFGRCVHHRHSFGCALASAALHSVTTRDTCTLCGESKPVPFALVKGIHGMSGSICEDCMRQMARDSHVFGAYTAKHIGGGQYRRVPPTEPDDA